MEGLKRIVRRSSHRKELVAGGLAGHLTTGTSEFPSMDKSYANRFVEYSNLVDRLGNRANDFWTERLHSHRSHIFQPMRLLKLPLTELPQARLPQTIFCSRRISCRFRSSLPFGLSTSPRRYRSPWPLSTLCNEHQARLWTASGCSSPKRGMCPSD